MAGVVLALQFAHQLLGGCLVLARQVVRHLLDGCLVLARQCCHARLVLVLPIG
jgi:hypothetical protein